MLTSPITIEATVNVPIETAWELWTTPEHITKWNAASDDWHTPHATVDLRQGGTFTSRMEAKDGSMGFDFSGTYLEISAPVHLAYKMDDNRRVTIEFNDEDDKTHIVETFDAEDTNPLEMQRDGWQSILDNFKQYAESLADS